MGAAPSGRHADGGGRNVVLTVLLYVMVPKGFFPVQDTGAIQGISEAPQSISFSAMAERQQQLAKLILKDPAVESLSSFIGIDGVNTTLNSGRMLINLKPLAERDASATEVIRRLQPELSGIGGIELFMQPVQDLTVDAKVSRTQFQYTLEDPNNDELKTLAPRIVEAMKARPELRDVSSDQQEQGLRVMLDIDRTSASRLGITTQNIDDALYDAFGQRQVSTTFTELNQYRVVLAVKPDFRQGPNGLQSVYLRQQRRESSATQRHIARNRIHGSAGNQPPGAVSRRDRVVQPGPRRCAGRCRRGDRAKPKPNWTCRPASREISRGPPQPSRPRSTTNRC